MKTYTGGCHCGNVRYEVVADIGQVISCNCSFCSKQGWLLAFVGKDAFTLTSGEGATTEYLFNKKHISHRFCKTCGIESYAYGKGADGKESVAINVRCLDGVDPNTLTVMSFDGKSL